MYNWFRTGLVLTVLAVFSVSGVRMLQSSSAATANPHGVADYCKLEDGATVIYGWAIDAQAAELSQPRVTVNGGPVSDTAKTNQSGYRGKFVNDWIDANRPGDPKPGTYGFRAVLTGIFRGEGPFKLSGTVLNEGAGSNVPLNINSSGHVDGDTSKPYFDNKNIPPGCLPVRPVVPPPAPPPPPPPPTPGPTPAPTPSPSPTPKPPSAPPPPAGTPIPPGAPLSSAADATVSVGTLAAKLRVPFGNASKIHITYGANTPILLDQNTSDIDTNGTDVDILLPQLSPLKTYSYQIVRTDAAGKTATSETASFKTKGFTVIVSFTDSSKSGIQGVPASVRNTKSKGTSNNDGRITFQDIPEGTQTVDFTYQDKKYDQLIVVRTTSDKPSEITSPDIAIREFSINIDKLGVATTKELGGDSKTSSTLVFLVAGGALLLLVLGALFMYWRRRTQHDDPYPAYGSDYTITPPAAPVVVGDEPDALPEAVALDAPATPETPVETPDSPVEPEVPSEPDDKLVPVTPAVAPPPPLDIKLGPLPPGSAEKVTPHMGESLKDMVLRSMAEEAARRRKEEAQAKPDKPAGPTNPKV